MSGPRHPRVRCPESLNGRELLPGKDLQSAFSLTGPQGMRNQSEHQKQTGKEFHDRLNQNMGARRPRQGKRHADLTERRILLGGGHTMVTIADYG